MVAFGGVPQAGEVDDVDVLAVRLPLVEFVGHTAPGVVADGAHLPAEEGVDRGGLADPGLSADDDVRLSLLREPITPPAKQFCELLEFGGGGFLRHRSPLCLPKGAAARGFPLVRRIQQLSVPLSEAID